MARKSEAVNPSEMHRAALWVAADRVREVAEKLEYEIAAALKAWDRPEPPMLRVSEDVACLLLGPRHAAVISAKYSFGAWQLRVRVGEGIETWQLAPLIDQ